MLKPHQVSIETGVLQRRLTKVYESLQSRGESAMAVKHFEDLWDIKEKALLERLPSVVVPSGWLSQIDEADITGPTTH